MNTILLLDDESVVMQLLRIILKEYRLVEATTAEQAFRFFADRDCDPALLLTDLTLSKTTGIQVAMRLRLELPDLPVILTSGYPLDLWSDQDTADLESLGSNSVVILQKPFYPQALSNAIFELIGSPQTEMVRTA